MLVFLMCLFDVFNTEPTTTITNTTTSIISSITTSTTTSSKSNIPVHSPISSTTSDRPNIIPIPATISDATSSLATKRPSSSSSSSHQQQPQHSNIPILSPDIQKRQFSCSSTSKKDSDSSKKKARLTESQIPIPKTLVSSYSTSSFLHREALLTYNSDIEDILTWLLGAEDHLATVSEADQHRFTSISAAISETNETDSGTDLDEYHRQRHRKIMSAIEAGEYAKQRVESHEEFMSNLTEYHKKIVKTFEIGEKLIGIGSVESIKSNKSYSSSTTSSLSSAALNMSTSNSAFDLDQKRVIALQMQLLDDRFNQLRIKAINHQKYLLQHLVETQNAQLDGLRRLMTQTEEKIAVIIPERFDEMPVDLKSLESQLAEYEQLQEAMAAEQGLLNDISKFVVFEEHVDGSKDGFEDQLEALNDRWITVCRITEDRGKFLHGLKENYQEFSAEESKLQDWFNRLERRLADMEESIDELEERPIRFDATMKEVKQEQKFLEDIKKRLHRMETDIFYGTDQSQKLHAYSGERQQQLDNEDEMPMARSPLSKITTLTHTLLGKFGDKGLCLRIPKLIESICTRWDTLAVRIEHSQEVVRKRIEQLDDVMHQHLSSEKVEERTLKNYTNKMKLPILPRPSTQQLPTIKSNATSLFSSINTSEEKFTTQSTNVSPSAIKIKTTIPLTGITSPAITTISTNISITETSKRRKVDFFGVVEWQNLLDCKIKWLDRMESTVLKLSVAGNFFEGLDESIAESETVESVNLSTLSACLEQYDQLKRNKTLIHQLIDQCFDPVGSEKLLDVATETIQTELEQLGSMETELSNQRQEFLQLVQRGEKIIADFKSGKQRLNNF